MSTRLHGRVVVITGGSAGIGRATALAFARAGCSIALAARRPEKLEEARSEVESAGAKCLTVPTDVARREYVQRLLDATLEHFGRVDIWINNAGSGLVGFLEETTPEEMEQLWRVNFLGAFHGCQVALAQMRRQERGHIMNVSSLACRFPLPLGAAYTATKCAMTGLSESLSLELRGSGIHVSTILPGVTKTDFGQAMIRKIPPPARKSSLRAATAEQVAARMVACAQNPRPRVYMLPAAPLTLALFDLFPSLWDRLALRYRRFRLSGMDSRE